MELLLRITLRRRNIALPNVKFLIASILASLMLWGGSGFGQTGPGGIGTADLVRWFRADAGHSCINSVPPATQPPTNCQILLNGEITDQSPSTDSAWVSANTVRYQIPEINFNEVFEVTTNGSIEAANLASNELTVFVVFKSQESSNVGPPFSSQAALVSSFDGGPSQSWALTMDNGNLVWTADPQGGTLTSITSTGGPYNDNTSYLVTAERAASAAMNLWVDNNLVANNPAGPAGTFPSPDMRIGAHANGGGPMQADVAELLIYDRVLTTNERQRVQTFLAIKYGVTLDHNYIGYAGTGIYDVTTHGNGVVGITYEDGSGGGFIQNQAFSNTEPNGFTLYLGNGFGGTFEPTMYTNAAIPNSGEYLIAGHNNGTLGFTTAFEGVANSRYGRVYKIEDTGGISNVTLDFDNTVFNGLVPGAAQYYLVVSNDQNFNANDNMIALNDRGNGHFDCEHNFANDAIRYFTIVAIKTPGAITTQPVMWFRSDEGVTDGGAPTFSVSAWDDQSGNDLDVTGFGSQNPPAGPGTVSQIYGAMNFNPGVEFLDRYANLPHQLNSNDILNDDMSLFIVYAKEASFAPPSGSWWNQAAIISREEDGDDEDWGITIGNTGEINFAIQDPIETTTLGTSAYLDDEEHIVSGIRDRAGVGYSKLFVDGFEFMPNGIGTNTDCNDAPRIRIGAHAEGNAGQFDAFYGEIICFDNDLTSATDIQKIHTYLAIKYGISLPLAVDYLNPAGTTVYSTSTAPNEIIGIAKDSTTVLDQRQSEPSGNTNSLTMYYGSGFVGTFPAHNTVGTDINPNPLPEGVYIITGHSGNPVNIDQPFDGVANTRMHRIWTVTETGVGGTVTLDFDDATFTTLSAATSYSLVVSSDLVTWDLTDNVIPMTLHNTNDFYVEVDFPDNQTSYFTIIETPGSTAPGGVTGNLELWYRADFGYADATTGNSDRWDDQSGNNFDLTTVQSPQSASFPISFIPFATFVNYNPYVETGPLTQEFRTGAHGITGNTIVTVAKASSPDGRSGLMGFENFGGNDQLGIRSEASTNSVIDRGTNPSTDWTSPNFLRGNGVGGLNQIATDPDWNIITAERPGNGLLAYANAEFFIGGFENDSNRTFTTYNFAEIVVFDSAVTAVDLNKVETYLAVKYGITLEDDYHRADGNPIFDYNTGGYQGNVAGIGRDDSSSLYQRQSMNQGSEAVIAIGIDTITPTNAVNGGIFPNNGTFIVWGHDQGEACWTNINSPDGENYLRLDRQWRMEVTGSLNDTLHISAKTNNANFYLPGLPPGSSNYYLLMDDDGDFTNGGNDTIRMFPGTNSIFANVDNATFTSRNFFTIGVLLGPLYHAVDTCATTMQLYAPFVGDATQCSMLHLDDGFGNTFDIYRGLTTNDSTFLVIADGPGNCLDTLLWNPADTLMANDNIYTLTMAGELGGNCCNCSAAQNYNNPAPLVLDSIRVGIDGSPTMTLPSGGNLCLGYNNPPLPTVSIYPGTFSIDTSYTGLTTQGLFSDSTTGQIIIHSGAVGTHVVCYSLAGNCPTAVDVCDTVRVNAPSPLTFAYTSPVVCENVGSGVQIDSVSPNVSGRFDPIPAMNALNSTTGAFNPSLESPGIYAITFTPDSIECALPHTDTIHILQEEVAAFTYPSPGAYCQFGPNPFPNITYRPDTSWNFICTNCISNELVVDTITGEIDLSLSLAGNYTVALVPNASDTCAGPFSVNVRVLGLPDPSFTLDTSYCQSALPATISSTVGGGTFSDPSGNLTFNSNQLASGPLGGPYPVQYAVSSTQFGVTCTDSVIQLTSIVGVSADSIFYPNQINFALSPPRYAYCLSDSNPYPTFFSGITGGIFLNATNPANMPVDSATGVVDLANSVAGNYYVTYQFDSLGCTSNDTIAQMLLEDAADAAFSISGADTLCEFPDTLFFTNSGFAPSSQYYIWRADTLVDSTSTGFYDFDDPRIIPGFTYTVQHIATNSNFIISCRDTAYDFVFITPKDDASFSYADTSICNTFDNPNPFIPGTTGGTFTSLTLGTNAIGLDPVTGLINLDTSVTDVGTHIIQYETFGACPDTQTVTLNILPGRSSSFEYTASEICNTADTLAVATIASPGAGIFACSNFAGIIDPLTGELDLSLVTQDTTLHVSYTTGSGASFCQDVTFRDVLVGVENTALDISYPPDTFCRAGLAYPVFQGGVDGTDGQFSIVGGVTFINIDSGIVSLGSSLAGQQTIVFQLGGICQERDTAFITIEEFEDASFQYPTSVICDNDSLTLTPIITGSDTGSFGGVGSQTNDTLVWFDQANGVIDLIGTTEGIFDISHIIGGNCPDTVTVSLTVAENPAIGALQVSPNDSICGIDTVTVGITVGGLPSFLYVSPDTTFTTQGSYFLTLTQPEDGAVVTGIIENTAGCRDSVSVNLTLKDVPAGTPSTWSAVITGQEGIEIVMEAFTNNTYFVWDAVGSDNITVDSTSGVTDIIQADETTTLVNSVTLASDFTPGTVTYTITPEGEGCIGEPDTLIIAVNPNEDAIFIPGVFTPNDDMINDTWQIQLRSDLSASDYTIDLYNRTGGLVYTMNPLTDTWNGGNLPDGVYWYLLKDVEGAVVGNGGLTIRRR